MFFLHEIYPFFILFLIKLFFIFCYLMFPIFLVFVLVVSVYLLNDDMINKISRHHCHIIVMSANNIFDIVFSLLLLASIKITLTSNLKKPQPLIQACNQTRNNIITITHHCIDHHPNSKESNKNFHCLWSNWNLNTPWNCKWSTWNSARHHCPLYLNLSAKPSKKTCWDSTSGVGRVRHEALGLCNTWLGLRPLRREWGLRIEE